MEFKNPKTLLQLRDAAIAVANRRDKLEISKMLNIELKFSADAVLKWFNLKIKSGNLEIDPRVKRKYKINNPINWEKDKCCVCNFPLHINPKGLKYEDSEMPYTVFIN